MSYIVDASASRVEEKVQHLGSFLSLWLIDNPQSLLRELSPLISGIFSYMRFDDFKELSKRVCSNTKDCKRYLQNFRLFFHSQLDFSNVYVDEGDNVTDLLDKLILLTELDEKAQYPVLWKYMQAIFELAFFPLEGYVFLHQKQLKQIQSKYTLHNPFDELLGKATDINDCLVESNIIHPGVNRIIIGYL